MKVLVFSLVVLLSIGLFAGYSYAGSHNTFDFGDAPDGGPTGYATGILLGGATLPQTGSFPTTLANDGARTITQTATLGTAVSTETDANITDADSDDGLIQFGISLTSIPATGRLNVEVNSVNNLYFLNALADLNQDGEWGGFGINGEPEWIVQNERVNVSSGIYTSERFAYGSGNRIPEDTWVRVALTTEPVPNNWDGTGVFTDGEIEDHFIHIDFPPPRNDDDDDSNGGGGPGGGGGTINIIFWLIFIFLIFILIILIFIFIFRITWLVWIILIFVVIVIVLVVILYVIVIEISICDAMCYDIPTSTTTRERTPSTESFDG